MVIADREDDEKGAWPILHNIHYAKKPNIAKLDSTGCLLQMVTVDRRVQSIKKALLRIAILGGNLGANLYLFNECPVTEEDVELWLDTIPTLSAANFRRQAYRKAYRIEDKIRAAKAAGHWPPQKENTWPSTNETTY